MHHHRMLKSVELYVFATNWANGIVEYRLCFFREASQDVIISVPKLNKISGVMIDFGFRDAQWDVYRVQI